jgi:hypothetical protein
MKETTNALLETFTSDLKKAKDAYTDIAKKASKALFRDLFDLNPSLQSFSWKQYSPFFNDGDECVFCVHSDSDEIGINGQDRYDYDYEDTFTEEMDELSNQVSKVLDALPADIMQEAFGNHVQVTMFRDKEPETEEYDHD